MPRVISSLDAHMENGLQRLYLCSTPVLFQITISLNIHQSLSEVTLILQETCKQVLDACITSFFTLFEMLSVSFLDGMGQFLKLHSYYRSCNFKFGNTLFWGSMMMLAERRAYLELAKNFLLSHSAFLTSHLTFALWCMGQTETC